MYNDFIWIMTLFLLCIMYDALGFAITIDKNRKIISLILLCDIMFYFCDMYNAFTFYIVLDIFLSVKNKERK